MFNYTKFSQPIFCFFTWMNTPRGVVHHYMGPDLWTLAHPGSFSRRFGIWRSSDLGFIGCLESIETIKTVKNWALINPGWILSDVITSAFWRAPLCSFFGVIPFYYVPKLFHSHQVNLGQLGNTLQFCNYDMLYQKWRNNHTGSGF